MYFFNCILNFQERSTQDLHDSTCMSCFKVFDKEIDLRAHVVGVHHATYERYLEQKARKVPFLSHMYIMQLTN